MNRPCRYLVFLDDDGDWHKCGHPVMLHHALDEVAQGSPFMCHGCPCHEPQPEADFCEYRRTDIEVKAPLFESKCGYTYQHLIQDGHPCPYCKKPSKIVSQPDPTPTGGKTGHDKP